MTYLEKSSLSITGVLNLTLLVLLLFNTYLHYFDFTDFIMTLSINLLIILLFIFLFTSKLLSGFIKGFFIFFIYTIIVNYLLRFISLAIWPYDFGGILGSESNYIRIPTSKELINSIFLLSAFILEVFLVLLFFNKLAKKFHYKFIRFSTFLLKKRKSIFLLLFFSLILQILFSFLFDWKMGSTAWKFGWINRLLPITFLFFLFAFIQIMYWDRFSKKDKYTSYLIYALYIISGLIIGSRSAIFNLFSSFFIILLVVKPNFRISLKKLVLTFFLSLIFGGAFWILGTAIRSSNTIDSSQLTFVGILIEVVQRLSAACDSFIAISNNWNNCMNSNKLDDVMSMSNLVPQFVNSVVPGEIFNIDPLYIPAVYFRENVFGFDNFISNGDVFSGFGWFLVKYGYYGIIYFPIFMAIHFLIFRFFLKFNNFFFYISFYYFNWMAYDFILHGSFIVSGLYGLFNNIFFTLMFFFIFKLRFNKI